MKIPHEELIQRRKLRREAAALQEIEGNPFTQEDWALFEMFDREGWNDEERIAYINEQAGKEAEALNGDKRRA